MAKITISTSNQAGDIPTYEFTKNEIQDRYFVLIEEQLELSEDKVFVCFQSWKDCEIEDENPSFFISKDLFDVANYFKNHIKIINAQDINFNFFCFESYKEAFLYSIDLKEGL